MDIFKKIALGLFVSTSLVACGGGGGDSASNNNSGITGTTYNIESGVFQKGPFVAGVTVTIKELGSNLQTTGVSYQSQTDASGHFSIANIKSRYVEVTATGSYFDELTGVISESPVTLTAILDLTENSSRPSVNTLTTLQTARYRELVKQGQSLDFARDESKKAVLTAFGIEANAVANLSAVDLMGGATADEKILRATLALLKKAKDDGVTPDVIITKIANDIQGDGLPNSEASVIALALPTLTSSADIAGAKDRLANFISDRQSAVVYQTVTASELAKAAAAILVSSQVFTIIPQKAGEDANSIFQNGKISSDLCKSGSLNATPLVATESTRDGSIQYNNCTYSNGLISNGTFALRSAPVAYSDYLQTFNMTLKNSAINVTIAGIGEQLRKYIVGSPGDPKSRSIEIQKGRASVYNGASATDFIFPESFYAEWFYPGNAFKRNDIGHGGLIVKNAAATNCINGQFSYTIVSSLTLGNHGLNYPGGSIKISSGDNELGTVTFNEDESVDVTLKGGTKKTVQASEFLNNCGLGYDLYNNFH